MRNLIRLLQIPLVLLTLAAGCKSVGPDFHPPHEPVPAAYDGLRAPAAEHAPTAEDGTPLSFWWQAFHDPTLDRLEADVCKGNLNLKAAYLRILEARTQVQSARAQGLPSLNASASYEREQLGVAGLLKADGGIPAGASATTQSLISTLEAPVNLYQVGFDASWEIDLFGKVRRSVEASEAQATEAAESRNDLLVSLEAEVAETYLQLRAAQVLKQITVQLIADQQEVADLTLNRREHGLADEADVQSADAQLASLQSQLPSLDQTIATSRHALAVLAGEPPAQMDAAFGETGELPDLPDDVPVGLPASLARRRPDIRNAEAALHMATAEVGVSVASLFPDVSLAGTYGLRNTKTGYLFDWASHFYTFGPTVSLPIFEGGALIANVRLSKARAAEAALSYRQTVLSALEDVEDGLSSLHVDAVRTAALGKAVKADQRALDIDLNSYHHGLITYISVLTRQLQTVQARQQLAQAALTQSTDLVKLYKALGGGWERPPPDPAQAR
jgi:NodT family efflux transporter outer membrane factor (OMF) lipoprotein